MKTEKDYENVIAHVNRIIENLNQHWHTIQLLLGHVSKPILVDDRGLAHHLRTFHDEMYKLIQEMRDFNFAQTIGEIKYIGNRLNEIEVTLKDIQEKGLTKNIQLEFSCDGYQLVKKPISYNPQEPIEEPDESLKELLNTLTQKEAKCIIYRIGLFGNKAETYKKIGEILNLTGERAKQIYSKAIRKCRHSSRSHIVDRIQNKKLKEQIFS